MWCSTRLSFRFVLALAVLSVALNGCTGSEPPPPPLPVDESTLERGRQLVEGLGSCGFCHGAKPVPGAPLSGGRLMADKFGELVAPNITPHETGVKMWSEEDFTKAFRLHIDPQERMLSREFHGGFAWISDPDLAAIVAYIRRLPPVEHSYEHRDLSFVERNTTGLFETRPEVKGLVPRVFDTFRVEYGQYLTDHVARCSSCHNGASAVLGDADDYMAGGLTISFDGEERVAPNITQHKESGIGQWDVRQILNYLRTGETPDGEQVDERFCPTQFFRLGTPRDLVAVAAYVKSVPPQE